MKNKPRKRKMEKTTWQGVSIPKPLLERADKVWRKLYGYGSLAEYVRDALRRKVQNDEIKIRMEKDEEHTD